MNPVTNNAPGHLLVSLMRKIGACRLAVGLCGSARSSSGFPWPGEALLWVKVNAPRRFL